jgi:hypothetical protein
MARRDQIRIPERLRPLLEQRPNWPVSEAYRISAAACRRQPCCRMRGPPGSSSGGVIWLNGRTESRPGIVQSECVDALLSTLRFIPSGAAVEVIAPTSLRYLVEGEWFPPGSPEHCLAHVSSRRRIWARYAVSVLGAPVADCLARASA